eukprot:gnl/MRDRNA2_/MRDRNA2_164609_c0_seq1.p1 gnl/MRDRNA2_/MRDRNA2_164609_c0~~gnl/MRDRNA2_/MRDRNA2_164609_c0_seq1.p1  ORF type:complete len:293 (+),score=58.45 gnl/MRDRNA2_/MRDRNA2_164609_c0_seq1:112-879(+)
MPAPAVEDAKGSLEPSHLFKFKNSTTSVIKVLLEEDQEAEVQVADAHTKAVTSIPNHEFTLMVGEEADKTMKSQTVLYTAAFVEDDGLLKIFRKQVTVAAGTNTLCFHIEFTKEHEDPAQLIACVQGVDDLHGALNVLALSPTHGNDVQTLQQHDKPDPMVQGQHVQQAISPVEQPNDRKQLTDVPAGFIPISGQALVFSKRLGWVLGDLKALAVTSTSAHEVGSVLVQYTDDSTCQKIIPPKQFESMLKHVVSL